MHVEVGCCACKELSSWCSLLSAVCSLDCTGEGVNSSRLTESLQRLVCCFAFMQQPRCSCLPVLCWGLQVCMALLMAVLDVSWSV